MAEASWDSAFQPCEPLSVNWSILVVCDQFTPQYSGEMMKRKTEAEFFYLTKRLTVTHNLQSGYNQSDGGAKVLQSWESAGKSRLIEIINK